MGIDDWDDMGENQVQPAGRLRRISSGRPDDPTPRQLLVAVGQMLVTFVVIILSLRLPASPFVKLLLGALLLTVGARWIIRTYRRSSL